MESRLLVSRLLAGLICTFVLAPVGLSAAQEPRGAENLAPDIRVMISAARDRVFPALVNIQVVTVNYWGGKETKGSAIGSGTIISADGLVLTNQHVVDNGRTFKVTLSDKQEINATLVGEDPLTDLAVLRLAMGEYKGAGALPSATFDTQDDVRTGDYVLAMGSPFGLSRSVTLGIVSNTERVFTGAAGDDIADQEFDFDQSSDIFTRWIQHDALINPGNSGGPLVNLRGEVVGVNTRGGAGMSFAVPAVIARDIARKITEHGEVIRSTIGVSLKSVKRSGYSEGILVNSVNEDGPAGKAGVKAGDAILEINGKKVSARFPEEIPLVARTIADMPVGSTVTLVTRRGGERSEGTQTATLTTEKMDREKPEEAAIRVWGLTVRQITDRMARSRKLESTKGAMVFGVRGGGPAQIAEPAIGSGDIIRGVDGKAVDSIADMVSVYREIMKREPLPEFVTIEFERNGKNQLTLIKPKPQKPEDPPREVPKGWIGVATQPVLRDLAKQIGLEGQLGFRVTRVYPKTLADRAGLKVGDIITQINGEKLQPRGMQDAGMLTRMVRKLSIGESAKVTLLREKQSQELSVELERTRITPDEALRDTNKDFELTVRELTFFDRDDARWDESVQGVIVVDVEDAGWASFAGVFPGDLIQRINDAAISDIATYRRAMEEIAKQQPARVTFVVLRGQRTQFKFAEPDWKPTTKEEAEKQTKPGE